MKKNIEIYSIFVEGVEDLNDEKEYTILEPKMTKEYIELIVVTEQDVQTVLSDLAEECEDIFGTRGIAEFELLKQSGYHKFRVKLDFEINVKRALKG